MLVLGELGSNGVREWTVSAVVRREQSKSCLVAWGVALSGVVPQHQPWLPCGHKWHIKDPPITLRAHTGEKWYTTLAPSTHCPHLRLTHGGLPGHAF